MPIAVFIFTAGDQPVWVAAVNATSGEQARIMYSNSKVIGSGSFGMVFSAKLNGECEVAIKKVLQDKRFKVCALPFFSRAVFFADEHTWNRVMGLLRIKSEFASERSRDRYSLRKG